MLLQLPLAPGGRTGGALLSPYLGPPGFHPALDELDPSLAPPTGPCLDDSFHQLTGGHFQTPTNICSGISPASFSITMFNLNNNNNKKNPLHCEKKSGLVLITLKLD